MSTSGFGGATAGVWPTPPAVAAGFGRRPAGRREPAPIAFAFLIAFLALLFLSLPLVWPTAARFAPAHAIAAAALGMVFVERTAARLPLRLVWPDTHLLIGFVAVAALSCFTALWSGFAVDNTLLLVRYVAIYLLIVNATGSLRRLRVLFGVMAFGGLVPALGALHGCKPAGWSRGVWVGWASSRTPTTSPTR